jgi:nickel-dependent lactate racemase
VAGRVRSCTAVVALGTHAPMSDDARRDLVGTDALPVVNHEWWDDGTFAHVGTLGPDTVKTR